MSDLTPREAEIKLRALNAIRVVLVRELEIIASVVAMRLDPATKGGHVKAALKSAGLIADEEAYWAAKEDILRKMLEMVDKSRAANIVIVAHGTDGE